MPSTRDNTISDAYFYDELLRHIGPQQTNEWFQDSVLHPVRQHKNSMQSPSSPGSNTRSSSSSNETVESFPSIPQENSQDTETTSNHHLFVSLESDASNFQGKLCMAALDVDLTHVSSEHIGLLFTDAAHLVLHATEKSEILRRRNSSFF